MPKNKVYGLLKIISENFYQQNCVFCFQKHLLFFLAASIFYFIIAQSAARAFRIVCHWANGHFKIQLFTVILCPVLRELASASIAVNVLTAMSWKKLRRHQDWADWWNRAVSMWQPRPSVIPGASGASNFVLNSPVSAAVAIAIVLSCNTSLWRCLCT